MGLLFSPLVWAGGVANPQWAGNTSLAARSTDDVAGHPEAFLEAFANYSDAAEAIAADLVGPPDPLALYFPNAIDGAIGLVSSKRSVLEPGWRLLDRRHQVGTEWRPDEIWAAARLAASGNAPMDSLMSGPHDWPGSLGLGHVVQRPSNVNRKALG